MWNYVSQSEMELYHHGILGMRWGKRNGPPYPLSSSAKSYSEKKHSKIDKKKVAKAAAVAGGVALAGAAGYAAYKTGALSKAGALGKKAGDKAFEKAVEKTYHASKAVSDSITRATERHHERKRSTIKNMSDKDLNKRIERLKKENEYARLMGRYPPNDIGYGKKIARETLESMAGMIIVPTAVGYAAYKIKSASGDPNAKREIIKNINVRKKK